MGVIRGAICAENTQEDISQKAVELIGAIFTSNNLSAIDVEAVIFSATADLDASYPAAAVREKYGLDAAAFMCLAEMPVKGSMEHCLRVSVFARNITQGECRHCYLGRAASLRKDLK